MAINFSIIIPNLNGKKYLEGCLPTLKIALNALPKIVKYEVILVDNASVDESQEYFKKILTGIEYQVISNNRNFGFSPAINQGIKISKYEWLVLLNNDLDINPDWFTKVYEQIKLNTDKYAVYCGTVLTKDGTKYESLGLEFDYRGQCKNINNGQPFIKKQLGSKPQEIWGTSAAFAIYNKKILANIGEFDSDFFAYEEDVDVALRLHLLGHKTLLVPTAICFHLGGGTSSKMNNFRYIMDVKNWFYILIKDYPQNIIWQNLFNIFVERLRNLSGLTKTTVRMYGIKSFYYLPIAYSKSYGEVITLWSKMFDKRKKFQSLLKTKL